MTKPAVAYIRVSTARQGRSGLGLEAQQAAIARFCEAEGFEVVAERIEVETGKGADALDRRPELAAALAEAKRRNGAERLAPAYRQQAIERAVGLKPVLSELQAQGLSARGIAGELNRRGAAPRCLRPQAGNGTPRP